MVSDKPVTRRRRRLVWIAAVLLPLLAAILAATFLRTTQLVRLALGLVLPANSSSVGSAALGPSGTLVLRDLVLYDSGALAQQPLITAGEVDVAFGWAELLSGQIRRFDAREVTVYARSNGPSQLSLLDLFFQQSQSGLPAVSNRGVLPLRIDTIKVQGVVHLELLGGFMPARADWPLALQITMSDDRTDPTRQFRLAIGEVRTLPEKIPEQPPVAATGPAPGADAGFGLRAEVETWPAAGGARVVVHRLSARDAAFTMETAALRRYATKLPADLQGPIDINLGALDVSGLIGPGTKDGIRFSGNIRLQDLSVRSPAGGQRAFALDRLTAVGNIESRLDRWAPAELKVRDGVMQWAALTYGGYALNNLDASWRIDGRMLMIDRCAAQIFDGRISGPLAWDLVTHAMPRCDFQMESINTHAALANIAPQHLDAEGNAGGFLHLVLSDEGELSGHVALDFEGPGMLRIGEIEEVRRMLVGNFGLDLANLALDDLKRYPFKEGKLYLESSGTNSQLQIKFARQARTGADVAPPRQEIINGEEVWVGSLVVPTIDMTIPITGKSLAEILSLVGGVHPIIEPVGEQHGK